MTPKQQFSLSLVLAGLFAWALAPQSATVVNIIIFVFLAAAFARSMVRVGAYAGTRLTPQLIDSIVIVGGVVVTVIAIPQAFDSVQRWVLGILGGTQLENVVNPLSIFVTAAGIGLAILVIITISRALPKACSEGRLPYLAYREVTVFAAAAFTASIIEFDTWNAPVAMAAVTGFVIPTLVKTRLAAPLLPAMWFFVPEGTRNLSLYRDQIRSVALTLSGDRVVNIVTLPDAAASLSGEHLDLAHKLDKIEQLFPTDSLALRQWRAFTPRDEAALALPRRELYVDADVMPDVLPMLLGTRDQVVVLSQSEQSVDSDLVSAIVSGLPTQRSLHIRIDDNPSNHGSKHVRGYVEVTLGSEDFSTKGLPAILLEHNPSVTSERLNYKSHSSKVKLSRLIWSRTKLLPSVEKSNILPWLFLPVMLLVAFNFQFGDFWFDIAYLLVPLAAWLGHRYGRSGFRALALGGLPMVPYLFLNDEITIGGNPGIYIISLATCLFFWRPGSLFERLERFSGSFANYLFLFGVLALSWGLETDRLGIYWYPYDLVLGGVFLVGMSAVTAGRLIAVLTTCVLIGVTLRLFDIHYADFDSLSFEYVLTHPSNVVTTLGVFYCGRVVRLSLQGQKPLVGASTVVLLLITSAIFTTALTRLGVSFNFGAIDASYNLLGYYDLFVLLMAFALGLVFGRRGLVITIVSGVIVSVLLGLLLGLEADRLEWMSGDSVEVQLSWRDAFQRMTIVTIALVFSLVGKVLHERIATLGNVYGREWLPSSATPKQDPTDEDERRPEKGYVVPWVISPFIFMLPISMFIGDVSIYFNYLTIPVAAWMGYRYRRSGLFALALALFPMLFYRIDVSSLTYNGNTGEYLVALVVCWACAYPDKWWSLLKSLNLNVVSLFLLLVIFESAIGIRGDFGSIGWTSYSTPLLLLVFVLGISGKRGRTIVAVSLGAALLGFILLQFDISRYEYDHNNGMESYVRYGFDSFRDLLRVFFIYALGRVIGITQRKPEAPEWLFSWRGYTAFVALWMFSAHYTYLSAEGIQRLNLTGSDYVIWVLAFTAGVVWRSKAVVAISIAIVLTYLESFMMLLLDEYRFTWEINPVSRISILALDWAYLTNVFVPAILFYQFGKHVASYLESAEGMRHLDLMTISQKHSHPI